MYLRVFFGGSTDFSTCLPTLACNTKKAYFSFFRFYVLTLRVILLNPTKMVRPRASEKIAYLSTTAETPRCGAWRYGQSAGPGRKVPFFEYPRGHFPPYECDNLMVCETEGASLPLRNIADLREANTLFYSRQIAALSFMTSYVSLSHA